MSAKSGANGGEYLNGKGERIVDTDIIVDMLRGLRASRDYMPVSPNIARKAGELMRDYGLNLPDALIAATALVYDAILVTRNIRDFQRIPNLRLEVPYE